MFNKINSQTVKLRHNFYPLSHICVSRISGVVMRSMNLKWFFMVCRDLVTNAKWTKEYLVPLAVKNNCDIVLLLSVSKNYHFCVLTHRGGVTRRSLKFFALKTVPDKWIYLFELPIFIPRLCVNFVSKNFIEVVLLQGWSEKLSIST